MKPLEGFTILDFSQFLAGPFASLRLADLGASVIKVEKPGSGDSYRSNFGPALKFNGDNAAYYFVNRGKESLSVDLKDPQQREKLLPLLRSADAMAINFRPEVTKRLGLDYESVRAINPGIVYGQITGYGSNSAWKDRPGQDLLVQCATGACYLNGSGPDPVPFGVSTADEFSGMYLVQGLLAGLYHKQMTGEGCKVETSLAEAMVDIEFENFGAFLNDGEKLTPRSRVNGANPCHSAPYGIYETQDGYLALAMTPVPELGKLLGCEAITHYTKKSDWFDLRDEIKLALREHLKTQTTAYWLSILEAADIWCAQVYDWGQLLETEGFQVLDMLQTIDQGNGLRFETTRCPIRIDGKRLKNDRPAPGVGEQNQKYHI